MLENLLQDICSVLFVSIFILYTLNDIFQLLLLTKCHPFNGICMPIYLFLGRECNIFISFGVDKFPEEKNWCHCSQTICTEVEKTE